MAQRRILGNSKNKSALGAVSPETRQGFPDRQGDFLYQVFTEGRIMFKGRCEPGDGSTVIVQEPLEVLGPVAMIHPGRIRQCVVLVVPILACSTL